MSCPTEPPADPKKLTLNEVALWAKAKRIELWIEWSGRTFGPYSSWDEAKQHGFKEPKD